MFILDRKLEFTTTVGNMHKRKASSSGNNNERSKIPKMATDQANAGKTKFNKEAFLRSVNKLKLYVDGDRYYVEARTRMGPLELDWT